MSIRDFSGRPGEEGYTMAEARHEVDIIAHSKSPVRDRGLGYIRSKYQESFHESEAFSILVKIPA